MFLTYYNKLNAIHKKNKVLDFLVKCIIIVTVFSIVFNLFFAISSLYIIDNFVDKIVYCNETLVWIAK